MTRHVRHLRDLGTDGILRVLDRAAVLKQQRGTPSHPRSLAGKSVAIVLEKASTRTRISFEVGIAELGGQAIALASRDLQLGRGEPIEDTVRMLSRYVHAVVYRTFGQSRIDAMVQHATIPIINGLSDEFHPCQLLADLLTVQESLSSDLSRIKVAWIGDGNNMANSWIEAAGLLGFELILACPDAYRPSERLLDEARSTYNANVTLLREVERAVVGVDVVTTDVWASMGQEEEMEARKNAFKEYMVTQAHMALASPSAIFLHCLPAHRDEEVTTEVLEGPSSRVWDQAENRLHSQKALLEDLLALHP